VGGTAWFITPDDPRPVGGIWAIYRFVDDLVASGVAARVVHQERGFRCRWFENHTPVTWLDDVTLGVGDLLAVPEVSISTMASLSPGTPMVLLSQGPYLTFHNAGLPPAPSPAVLPDSVVSIITGSEDARDYLELVFPETPIERIHYGVDPQLFTPLSGSKERAIAYMPRRRGEDLVQVLRILERRGALDGWRLYPIDRLTERGKAEVLGRSAIFLSFNEREGFGLPPVEAMAAGCVVIGFAGRGGREYLLPETSFLIEDGAIADFVRAVEHVIRAWNEGERFTELTTSAATLVASEYSPARAREDIVRAVSRALEKAAGIPPGTPTLRREPVERR
jgi:glycosyltransferase involved in cell wall biosynthesis